MVSIIRWLTWSIVGGFRRSIRRFRGFIGGFRLGIGRGIRLADGNGWNGTTMRYYLDRLDILDVTMCNRLAGMSITSFKCFIFTAL